MKLRSHTTQERAAQIPISADPVAASLIETGELSAEHLEQIDGYRQRTGASFADAVVDLGLVSPEVTSRAVTAHVPSSLIDPDATGVNRVVVAAYDPADPLAVKLRGLRSVLFNAEELGRGPARILILAGLGTDDTAEVAANLAVLVAQLGVRGLLVDANFLAPTQHVLFGVNSDFGVTSLLAGRARTEGLVMETPVPNLDLMAAGPDIAALSETAERVSLVAQLRALDRAYAFAIVDVGEQSADLVAALSKGADGAVIIVERNQTPLSSLRNLLDALDRIEVQVLGSVLSR